ncbi:MAG: pyrroloquinoline quinone biosynthesis protein PqqE [Rhodospirillales bacterium]|nr:pyrroloquinoline quinone biosynthesis protein PqqE [Rhodospirillales bacterium]
MIATAPQIGPPLALLAELSYRCPLRCPYCSNPLEMTAASGEMDTGKWIDVIEQAADMGVLQIHFSGGEPTVRKDLEDMVERAETLGIYTNLITSGVLLDRGRLQGLADRGLQHIQLSFQGADEVVADRIGGLKGGHGKKLETAKLAGEIGLPLTINAVMHRQNMDDLETMIQMAVDFGAKRLEVAHVQYYGWGLRNRAALLPTRAQLEHATAIVDAARERLKGVLVFDYVVPDYYAKRPKSCMGGWGRQFLNVSPSGRVMPCHAAETIPGMEFETVTERPLLEIWQQSDAFTRFRGTGWMPEPCRSCDRRELDWGGCRCQALALTGDAAAVDPACDKSPDHERIVALATNEAAAGSDDFEYRRFGEGA